MSDPIRIGLVGIGRAGWGMHCEELIGKEDKFRIVAACDVIPERLEKMRERYGCRTYSDIDALIADSEVELVDIATRSVDHFDHACKALREKKAVFQEKPLCETAEQLKVLGELSNKPGLPKLYARHNRRFEVHFRRILELVQSGTLGDVFEIHIARNGYSRRDDWQTLREYGGGQLLNWGPHIIDQSLRFLGGGYNSIWSDLKHTVAAGDCEDHLTIVFRNEKGLVVEMQISGGAVLPRPDYLVYGTKGAVEVHGKEATARYINPDQQLPAPVADPGTPGQSFGSTGTFASGEEIRWVEERWTNEGEDLSVIWDHLYGDYRNNIPFPISWKEAASVIDVIDRAKQGTPFA